MVACPCMCTADTMNVTVSADIDCSHKPVSQLYKTLLIVALTNTLQPILVCWPLGPCRPSHGHPLPPTSPRGPGHLGITEDMLAVGTDCACFCRQWLWWVSSTTGIPKRSTGRPATTLGCGSCSCRTQQMVHQPSLTGTLQFLVFINPTHA